MMVRAGPRIHGLEPRLNLDDCRTALRSALARRSEGAAPTVWGACGRRIERLRSPLGPPAGGAPDHQTGNARMIIADFTLGDALPIVLEMFLLVVWFWILIAILADLFRDHELSGWWKAVWVFFLIFVPFLTALIYLIARGHGMRERSIKEQADVRKHFESYVRETAATSPVDELNKLLRAQGQGRDLGCRVREDEGQAGRLTRPTVRRRSQRGGRRGPPDAARALCPAQRPSLGRASRKSRRPPIGATAAVRASAASRAASRRAAEDTSTKRAIPALAVGRPDRRNQGQRPWVSVSSLTGLPPPPGAGGLVELRPRRGGQQPCELDVRESPK